MRFLLSTLVGLALAAVLAGATLYPLLTPNGIQDPVRVFLGSGPLDAESPIPYFISDPAGVDGADVFDRDLARAAFEAWSRESDGQLRFVEAASEEDAVIRLVWLSPDRGVFGQTRRIPVDGKPGAVVYVTADMSGHGPAIARQAGADRLLRDAIVYLTCVHEIGHAIGLEHTRDFADIMYSFAYGGDLVEYFMRYRRRLETRTDIFGNSGLSENDIEALARLYPPAGAN